jgi:prolipoprotein diacylglyceryltransferase
MIFAGGLVAFLLALGRAKKCEAIPASSVLDITLLSLFAGWWGARIFYSLDLAHRGTPDILRIFFTSGSGMMLYGSTLFALTAIIVYFLFKKIPVIAGLDFVTPFMALVYSFVKLGCCLNGCCYGTACSLPWALKFPDSEVPVHPTQLYEALWCFLLFLFLSRRFSKPHFKGEITALFLALFPLGRFAIGWVRIQDAPFWLALTFNQCAEIGMFASGLLLYFYLRSRRAAGARI